MYEQLGQLKKELGYTSSLEKHRPIRGQRVRVLAGIALEQQRRRARLARQETKKKNRAGKAARRKNRNK